MVKINNALLNKYNANPRIERERERKTCKAPSQNYNYLWGNQKHPPTHSLALFYKQKFQQNVVAENVQSVVNVKVQREQG